HHKAGKIVLVACCCTARNTGSGCLILQPRPDEAYRLAWGNAADRRRRGLGGRIAPERRARGSAGVEWIGRRRRRGQIREWQRDQARSTQSTGNNRLGAYVAQVEVIAAEIGRRVVIERHR